MESKSSYSANRRCEIEIFGKRVSTGSQYCSEIACYFAKKSRILITVLEVGLLSDLPIATLVFWSFFGAVR